MLNLRHAGNPQNTVVAGRSTVSTLHFQLGESVVGNMGGSLDHRSSEEEFGAENLDGFEQDVAIRSREIENRASEDTGDILVSSA